jgi:hypothetical protein|tara:strand:- start:335 stop:970 length:636 start_codon:yes stop_codon:yes gene_type:complete
MISHKYKCIFIHIPRTGGTYVEKMISAHFLLGKDRNFWDLAKEEKHLIASQAKKKYVKYWNDYLKFTIIREPISRMRSMMLYSKNYFGEKNIVEIKKKHLDFYKKKYDYPAILEADTKFYDIKNLKSDKHKINQVYLNILDEKIDFIFRYENLDEDIQKLFKLLGIKFYKFKKMFIRNRQKTDHTKFKKLSEESLKIIKEIYKNDIEYFKY